MFRSTNLFQRGQGIGGLQSLNLCVLVSLLSEIIFPEIKGVLLKDSRFLPKKKNKVIYEFVQKFDVVLHIRTTYV